jgi:hypothetical protein
MGSAVVQGLHLRKASVPLVAIHAYPWHEAFVGIGPDLESVLASIWGGGYRTGVETKSGIASVPWAKAAEYGRNRAGELITEVAGATQREVEDLVRELLGATFDEADVSEADIAAALQDAFDSMGDARAELIADTETAFAANYGTLDGYRDTGVEYVQVNDGTDSDEACASVDGLIATVGWAEENALEHPNCGRSFDSLDSADVTPDMVDLE